MSSSSLTTTLRTVTNGKLKKLEKLQKAFEKNKLDLLSTTQNEKTSYERLLALYLGHTKPSIGFHLVNKKLDNIFRLTQLARNDVSVPESLLLEAINDLTHNLHVATSRYDYANLFGKMVTEWIENPDQPFKDRLSNTEEDRTGVDVEDQSNSWVVTPDNVAPNDLVTQRKALDKLWFSPDQTDAAQVRQYLDKLFSKDTDGHPGTRSPLDTLRSTIQNESGQVLQGYVTVTELENAIDFLLKLGLFVGEKREALLSLQSQPEVLNEMADVIKIDLESLDTWQYEQPVAMTFRRQVNLKSRVFTDEEVYVGILAQVVAARVSPFLATAFREHFDTWTSDQNSKTSMTTGDRLARQHYIGKSSVEAELSGDNVQTRRRAQYLESFFLAQLPRNFQSAGHYDEGADWSKNDEQAPFKIRQKLLKAMTVEMKLHTEFHGEFTVFQTDIRLFHPSISHTAILTILEFFGLDKRLLAFLKTFLSPRVFWADAGSEAQPQVRQRGTSIAHCMSTVLGEVMTFCLDFAVNQRTQGGLLYRMHDDIWFFGREEVCVKAWKAIEEFTETMGLELNKTKSGAAKVYDGSVGSSVKNPLDTALPEGEVSWGLLILDSEHGRWVVNESLVDMHIAELRRQLDASKSILSWVQRWNSYVAKYLSSNFGEPAYCLGADHLKRVVKSLKTIQAKVFEGTGHEAGGVSSYLQQRIASKFEMGNIADGFIFWPNELGGLGLRIPFVDFLNVQADVLKWAKKSEPSEGNAKVSIFQVPTNFKQALGHDEADWKLKRTAWEDQEERPDDQPKQLPADVEARMSVSPDKYMSLEEYLRFPEQTSSAVGQLYERLQETPRSASPGLSHELSEAVVQARAGLTERNEGEGSDDLLGESWSDVSDYWRWVIGLYGAGIMERFGGIAIAERRLLPFGLLTSMRSERVRWQD